MGLFTEDDFRPQFAGHETFPIRSLWLKKAYDAIITTNDRNIFTAPDAVVRFGVGKNMAQSMRHWGIASGFIKYNGERFAPSELGKAIFDEKEGVDPYLEHPASLWLLHLALAGTPEITTTWYWAFNHYGSLSFDREAFCRGLLSLAELRGWKRVAPVTIKRDVDCFLRSYVSRGRGALVEDAIEPVLVELGLVRPSPIGDAFEFVRGPKASLPDAVFAIALARFWRTEHGEVATLSAEAACYGPGSPGRVFKLDEDSVIERLLRIDEATRGAFSWSETAGLKQVFRKAHFDETELIRQAIPAAKRLAA